MAIVAVQDRRATRSRVATPSPVDLTWRIIVDDPLPGPRNMALDHALATTLRNGAGVLRLYGWARPTVSFGRNEPAAQLYSVEEAEIRGIGYVRRPTGGRAVMHDEELTYAVVIPERALAGPRSAYRRINEALVRGIGRLGVDAGAATEGEAMAPDAGPCFRAATPGEVVVGERKLVGSAQVRLDGALLQHGSLLVGGTQSVLGDLGCSGTGSGELITLKELMADVRISDLISTVAEGFRLTLGGRWRSGGYESAELDEADRLEQELYSRDEWTWRR